MNALKADFAVPFAGIICPPGCVATTLLALVLIVLSLTPLAPSPTAPPLLGSSVFNRARLRCGVITWSLKRRGRCVR